MKIFFTFLALIISQNTLAISEWTWRNRGQCWNCRIIIEIKDRAIDTENVQKFITALMANKQSILSLYPNYNNKQDLSDKYNLLAQMAIGILGNESKFFESYKYKIKESMPFAISAMKEVQKMINEDYKVTPNSRGPTQIKFIPTKYVEYFKLNASNLNQPENAAIATMGVLFEKLHQLEFYAEKFNLKEVNVETIVDYLPYFYYGNGKAVINRTAEPHRNEYVIQLKKNMSMVHLFEDDYYHNR